MRVAAVPVQDSVALVFVGPAGNSLLSGSWEILWITAIGILEVPDGRVVGLIEAGYCHTSGPIQVRAGRPVGDHRRGAAGIG